MIELFCKGLPKDLSNQIYNEYHNRLREINYIINARELYMPLKEHYKTVEQILGLSVYYRRVIVNLNAATMFATNIFRKSDASAVQIGRYTLDENERRRMMAISMEYQRIRLSYSIPKSAFEYTETIDYLRKIREMKRIQDIREQKKNDNG